MVREVPLTQGKVALVDDDDYESVIHYKWYAQRSKRLHGDDAFYAYRTRIVAERKSGESKCQFLHRFLIDTALDIDHENGDGLNCQRSNLRIATTSQNCANKRISRPNKSSRFIGVCWVKGQKKWLANIRANQRLIHIGLFDSEESAARARDEAAKIHFGEFARLNFD